MGHLTSPEKGLRPRVQIPKNQVSRVHGVGEEAWSEWGPGLGRAPSLSSPACRSLTSDQGLQENWLPLKDFAFGSVALGGARPSGGSGQEPDFLGQSVHGFPAGDLVVPVPQASSAVSTGGWRKWREVHDPRRVEVDRPSPGRGLPWIAARVPIGIWGMVLWTAVLLVLHPNGGRIVELVLWIPVGIVLGNHGHRPELSSPGSRSPAGSTVCDRRCQQAGPISRPGRWKAGVWVLLLTAWAIVSSLVGSWGGRTYLNEAAGGSGNLQAQAIYRSGDGGPDLLRLKAWINSHPEGAAVGVGVGMSIGLKPFGLAASRPPTNPGAALANRPGYDRPVGPLPGCCALDLDGLRSRAARISSCSGPVAKVGSAIVVSHIHQGGGSAGAARLGLPALKATTRPPITDRGFLRRDFTDKSGEPKDNSHYTVFVPYSYTGDRPYPLILFLHRLHNYKQNYGPLNRSPPAIEARKESFNLITVIPQGRTGDWSPVPRDADRALAILNPTGSKRNFGWTTSGST